MLTGWCSYWFCYYTYYWPRTIVLGHGRRIMTDEALPRPNNNGKIKIIQWMTIWLINLLVLFVFYNISTILLIFTSVFVLDTQFWIITCHLHWIPCSCSCRLETSGYVMLLLHGNVKYWSCNGRAYPELEQNIMDSVVFIMSAIYAVLRLTYNCS